ncbi:hypothetical protein [Sphingobium sp. YBL2]|uniref:hypothetical protein n=1 Tax=Sphingobium sp. (strain YBL2) TaxID=484429 RepID=UPI0005CBDC7B|nr:hypothetical protein [Sphingobium sp. YBL2]AJR27031.1 hypothetical protein TZ53_23565 [Sphingobium sp. YBL2]
MIRAVDTGSLSPKRQMLCSRDNALRVAEQIFDQSLCKVSVLSTGDPLQPYRVSTDPQALDRIILEMVA